MILALQPAIHRISLGLNRNTPWKCRVCGPYPSQDL